MKEIPTYSTIQDALSDENAALLPLHEISLRPIVGQPNVYEVWMLDITPMPDGQRLAQAIRRGYARADSAANFKRAGPFE